jgi:hypothetical protein
MHFTISLCSSYDYPTFLISVCAKESNILSLPLEFDIDLKDFAFILSALIAFSKGFLVLIGLKY